MDYTKWSCTDPPTAKCLAVTQLNRVFNRTVLCSASPTDAIPNVVWYNAMAFNSSEGRNVGSFIQERYLLKTQVSTDISNWEMSMSLTLT